MAPEIKYTKLFINNEWVDACSGYTFPAHTPHDGSVIAEVAEGDKADIDLAVAAAKAAFHRDSKWRLLDASARGRLLSKFADLVQRDAQYLGELDSYNTGKNIRMALGIVQKGVNGARYAASLADKIQGDTIPADGDLFSYTLKQPVGVCGLILPWNAAILMFVNKVCTALAAGCTVVVKPAEQAPLTSLALVTLLKEAGIPAGVVNVVTGFGPGAGTALTHHPDVAKISFTGSLEVDGDMMNRVLAYIEKGKQEGAKLMTGGNRIGTTGYYIEPTVFADVEDHMTIAKEEIFGPVQCIFKFETLKEAIDRANNTNYGLASGIFTKNINDALHFSKHVEAGNVWINTYLASTAQTPFGGFKDSGLGREKGMDCVEEYLEIKTVTISLPKTI
ncbi:aldehyde dehydrogenase 1A1-like isoform X4 [Leguminivora glycinivorella]|uniref:aldehyde dehydrogenase 1A1-like isoform X4 n=1 Tax=Leguminivora glycinivorella TaxID=1035111 RepID=UPI00200BD6D8|nr:aldehyde dehydrogenase 1A1-like isoform X4 [Leguminivora glycinivorella]